MPSAPTRSFPAIRISCWGLDLHGHLLAVNVNDVQEQRHSVVRQPVKDLSYLVRERLWMMVDDSGTLSYYSPREARVCGTFRYEIQRDQHLAAVRCVAPDRVVLVFTHSSHQPAMLVVHDPWYSKREVAKRDLGLGVPFPRAFGNGARLGVDHNRGQARSRLGRSRP